MIHISKACAEKQVESVAALLGTEGPCYFSSDGETVASGRWRYRPGEIFCRAIMDRTCHVDSLVIRSLVSDEWIRLNLSIDALHGETISQGCTVRHG